MRHLLGFFVLGALLFTGKRAVEAHLAERPQLSVEVAADASAHDIERAIDEAVLLDLALSSKSALIDPIVREQLLRAMRQQEHEQEHDQALLERAVAMGVHQVDPVVRQRLIFQARQVLRMSVTVPVPSQAQLEGYLNAHAERYREPERISFKQIFLSRTRRAQQLDADARALAQRLQTLQSTPEQWELLSDPTLLPLELRRVPLREIDARFGAGMGHKVHALPDARLSGPIGSSYGVHFIYVSERIAARLPPLAEQRSRVLADFNHDAGERALKDALRVLRNQYRISVRRATT